MSSWGVVDVLFLGVFFPNNMVIPQFVLCYLLSVIKL